jgi:hypothetical protein
MKAARLERLMQMSASEIHKSDCLRFERKYNRYQDLSDLKEAISYAESWVAAATDKSLRAEGLAKLTALKARLRVAS